MSLSSLPPTEGADVSNDSLFSDSVEFDAAQKPRDEAAEQLANGHGSDAATATAAATSDDGATTPNGHGGAAAHRGGTVPSDAGRLDDAVVPAPPPITSHMKPRQLATRQPQQWRDVQLRAPDDDDPDDEFDMASVQQPVYDTVADGGDATGKAPHAASSAASASGGKSRVAFLHGEPDARGDVTNCFDEPGLLYRIVDKKNRVWAFYNDSLTFEVHITCTFGKHSKLEALDHTQMTRTAADEYVAEVVVYPCETERFVKGFVNGFSSKLRAVPLSNEYYATRTRQQWDGTIRREIDAIRAAIAADVAHEQQQQQQRATDTASVDAAAAAATAVERDDEAILRVCLAHQLPFVDLTFPPTQASLDAGALRPLKRLPWVRPRMYVAPEMRDQLRLFRQPIVPGHVAEGELGDCWLMCAVATIAESPRALMQLFRHPRGADAGRHERALGAYRVTVNKNGLWRSVIVDDYLPVVANTPKFAHGTDPCELWPAILQKAYAKLHGSYAAIQAGDPIHALTDLTGCLSMRFDDEFALAAAEQHAASSTTAAAAAANASSSSSSSASAGAKTPLSPSSLKLFERLLRWHEAGHHIIVTTPGKAPAVLVDGAQNKTLDCSDEPELMQRLEGTGLLPGHAYTVLSLRHFVKERVQLVCLRRAWDYGLPVTGDWSATSSLWAQYPAIAANIQRHAAADASLLWLSWQTLLRHCTGGGVCFTGRLGTCGDDGDGGAAGNRTSSAARRRRNNNNSLSISHISNNNSIASLTRSLTTTPAAAAVYDYRVPLTFADGRPSVVFAVYVTQPTQLCLTLSNIDNRTLLGGSAKSSYVDADNDNEHGRRGSNKSGSGVVSNGGGGGGAADDGSHNGYGGGDDKTSMRSTSAAAAAMAAAAAVAADDASVIDYPPIMLSLCAPCEDEAATYDVVLNTAADVMRPSPSRWTFLQAREIGMMCELQPSTQPYLVLPRLMETADADANDVSASAIAAAAAVARASYKTLDRRYFANNYARSFPATTTTTTSAESEVPVTFGLRCAIALQPAAAASSSSTHEGAVSVRLCRLDGGNCVFENFPRFPSDDLGDVPAPLYYQVKPPQQGYADEKTGTALS